MFLTFIAVLNKILLYLFSNRLHVKFDHDRGIHKITFAEKLDSFFVTNEAFFVADLISLMTVYPFLLLSTILLVNEVRNYAKHNIEYIKV